MDVMYYSQYNSYNCISNDDDIDKIVMQILRREGSEKNEK